MKQQLNKFIVFPTLEEILDRHPLKVNPDRNVTEVISLMSQSKGKRSSSHVAIVEDKKLIGIFTERDAVNLIASETNLSKVKICQVISQPLIKLIKSKVSDSFVALSVMRQNQIRHLPIVNDNDELIGTISHDSVRGVLDPSALLKIRYLSEIMTPEVIHSSENVSVFNIAKLMSFHRISCVVIVKNQIKEDNCTGIIPVGIITERDLVELEAQKFDLNKIEARDIMSAPLFCLHPSDTLWDGYQLMLSKQVRRLVITDKREKLAGIVTQTSLLKVLDPVEMAKIIGILKQQVKTQTIEICSLHKQLEQKLQTTQSRLDQLLTSSPVIIYSRQIEDNLLSINFVSENVSSILGYQSQEFLCEYNFFLDRIHRDDRERVSNQLSKILENATGVNEYRFRDKNGNYRWLQDEFKLIKDSMGKPLKLVGYWIDITEKKQIENQLFHSQRLEILGSLASGIAHDFNNILTPIIATAQLFPLKIDNLDKQSLEWFNILETNGRRGADLVKQILSFARKAESKLINLQVSHLLLDIIHVSKTTFPKFIEISLNLPISGTLWDVLGDATQLHQVFMNLCVNARDAMPLGGILTISAENVFIDEEYAAIDTQVEVGNYVCLTFTDTGVGIPEKIKKQIFEPFFTTKDPESGTGLGLSTVISIIKNHQGFIEVESEVNKGTQFKIYLPAVEVKTNEIEIQPQLFSGNGELILIVDDEATIRQMTQAFLEEYNYKSLLAHDGNQAICLYRKKHREVKAVLMDLTMPSIDGLTAIQSLQGINPQVNIIATSGFLSQDRRASLIDLGIKYFLSKPYTISELLSILHQLNSPS